MNMNILLTDHIVERTMERTGVSREKAERTIMLAMERGKDFRITEGKIRKYLLNKQIDTVRVAKEYNGYCYIIDETSEKIIGITMFAIPKGIFCNDHYDGKNRIKNAKKYARFHGYDYKWNRTINKCYN